MYYSIFKAKNLLINYFMKTLKVLLPALLLTLTAFNTTAQVKKVPAKKKPVAVKKAVTITPRVIKKIPGIRIKLTTDSGVIVLRLYDSTPLHRDNFVKLVNEHFFDSLLFHRVIQDFMIQGGDPLSKNTEPGTMLGNAGSDMQRIPAEFRTTLFHKKGVLAAARDDNPEKASSACQFYIVQGKKYTDDELNIIEAQAGLKYTLVQRKVYKTIGGTPFLDMGYTVFGEVESGLNVVGKIARAPKDKYNRPLGDVRMFMEVIK
jgi:cyclophilin family peptidyl-prolyl cis-trans isomerase